MDSNEPLGLHPEVVKSMYGVHLRTIFRWVKKGHLASTAGRIHRSSIDATLQDWLSSVSKPVARKSLGVTASTLQNWKDNGLIRAIVVMGEERIVTDSLSMAPKEKKLGSRIKRRNHRSVCYMADLLHSAPCTIKKYLGTDIKTEVVDGVQMVPLDEVKRITTLINSSYTIKHAAEYLKKKESYVKLMISIGELESFNFLGRVRVRRSSLLALLKKIEGLAWLRDMKVPAL